MTVLVTGAAGFIGFHVIAALLERGEAVIGVDNINDYYDPALKRARLAQLEGRKGFRFVKADIAARGAIADLMRDEPSLDRVVHLAALARLLPERDPHPIVHDALELILDRIAEYVAVGVEKFILRPVGPDGETVIAFTVPITTFLYLSCDCPACRPSPESNVMVMVGPRLE